MKSHLELSDNEFMKQFAQCELEPKLFTHEAHLRLAWTHLHRYGLETALKNIQLQLQKYVKHLGAEDKYNTTLTIAAVKAVYHFMLRSDTINFKDFIAENPRLLTNFKELISAHYSTDIYNHSEAKLAFLEPDLLPFD